MPPRAARRRWREWLVLAGAVASSLGLAACGTSGASATPTTTSTPTTTTTTAPREPAGWTIVSETHSVVLADRMTFHAKDGSTVTIFRFRAGRVAYVLHVGSEDPPGAAALAVGPHGPALAPTERRRVIAAFNGGFKAASGSGGLVVAGRTVVALQRGRASLVIDASGAAHVGVWGGGLPAPDEHVIAVRQNLQLLVADGRASPAVDDLSAWGDTLGGVPNVARSALGQDAAGNLLYAGSMHALPRDVADALLAAGAVRAMELDINPYWVQLASTPHPGGTFAAGVPGQERPADQYLLGWTRDFVAVLGP